MAMHQIRDIKCAILDLKKEKSAKEPAQDASGKQVFGMKGFTGYYHNGHPVFVREDYEEAHRNDDELERIYDLTGHIYFDLSTAIAEMFVRDESMVYRNYSTDLDNRLRTEAGDVNGRYLWDSACGGWVHRITGELVKECRPERDSYPCWCTRETDPMSASDYADMQNKARFGLLFLGIGLLASLFGGESGGTDDDEFEDEL